MGSRHGAARLRRKGGPAPGDPRSLRQQDSSSTRWAPPGSHHPLRASHCPPGREHSGIASRCGCRVLTKALTPSPPRRARPAAAPGTHDTRDPVPNARPPANRNHRGNLTQTSLSATHVRVAARSALLRAPLARPAPRRQVGHAPRCPAQTPVSETVLWCLRKEIIIIIFLQEMRHWPRRRRKWEQANTRGSYPALESGTSVNSMRGGPWARGAFRPPP